MIDKNFIEPFLNKEIGVIYNESGRDFFLRGILRRVSPNTILISNPKHGDAIVSIEAIKKVKEMRDQNVE